MAAHQGLETATYFVGPAAPELRVVSVQPDLSATLPTMFGIGESVAEDRYQVTGLIPSSPYDEVYQATDWQSSDPGPVALKIFHEPDAATSRRVSREIQAHLLLDGQPGIVPLRDTGMLEANDQSYRYLVTGFAEGGTLADRIQEDPHNVDLILNMASQILPALGVMHGRDIIHRDIKPENILLDGTESSFELTDFGIADLDRFKDIGGTALHDEEAPVDSAIEMPADRVSGTIGFIAPEAFGLEEPIGPQVDVFGLGVVLFQGLTGQLPFKSDEPNNYYLSVTRESPVPIRSINSSVPVVLEELTMESLRKDPHDRPRVDELAARLQTV